MTFARIETLGLEAWLAGLRKDLVSKTYRPDPVRRVSIPKADGEGERLLGIPTIRDRVVQTAAPAARFWGVLVARAIISPSFLLKVAVSNGAISLPYIQSRTDLSELVTRSVERLLSVPF
jgi:hypothetical protein